MVRWSAIKEAVRESRERPQSIVSSGWPLSSEKECEQFKGGNPED
jgi:hypothetical protein